MGWGRWLLLGDLGQQLDLSNQRADLERMQRELLIRRVGSKSADKRLDELQRDSDQLKLTVAALVRLLVAKGLATTEEIRALVDAIDREDGNEDERHSGPILPKS